MRGFFIKPEKLNRNDSQYTDCYEKAVVFLSHLFQPVWFGRFFPTYMVIIFNQIILCSSSKPIKQDKCCYFLIGEEIKIQN